MPSVGLVLGAGGIVGAAFHAGVLTALAEAGFDARDADVIVGTSAGSGVGATLRAGFPPIDLAPRNTGRPISAEAAAIVGRTGGPPVIEFRPQPLSRAPRPSSPRMTLRAGRNPMKALAGLLPSGTISGNSIGERIELLYGDVRWPDRSLWINAVDLDSGDRVVFGRNDHDDDRVDPADVPIGVAVQASSAIPGFFEPVEHGGRRYVDGGVHSPTNADLLADLGLDIVVVISPMSATRRGQRASLPSARPMHTHRLASEVKRIRAGGTPVLTFQPTPADVDAMGRNPMDAARRGAVTEAALASARTRLNDPSVADRVSILRSSS
jgi:NTE family protein